MLFPTIDFAVFFALVFLGHWLLNQKPLPWKLFMIGASYVFYAWWDVHFIWLLAGVSVAAQLGAIAVSRQTEEIRKRLAMAVDDHSIACGDFEGVIGEGEYGSGPVIVWDRGTYENLREESMEDALGAGHASFWLEGEKLRGGWSLRHTDGRRWLLVKRRDEHADTGDPVSERPESVVSGRTIESLR